MNLTIQPLCNISALIGLTCERPDVGQRETETEGESTIVGENGEQTHHDLKVHYVTYPEKRAIALGHQ